MGVQAQIVMPLGAPQIKIRNTEALGAEVLLHGESYDECYKFAVQIAQQTGRVLVHAFEDPAVIAGQGTVALEIMQQLPQADVIFGAVGGGGLMAGAAIAVQELYPSVQLVGCQALGAPTMIRSIQAGRALEIDSLNTFADGIAVHQSSEKIRKILEPRIHHWVQVSDSEIKTAVIDLLEKAKTLAEGAGAVPLAALKKIKEKMAGKKIVLIVSGGNIDLSLLKKLMDQA